MHAVSETSAGFGGPGAIGAARDQYVDAAMGEGAYAGGKVFVPEEEDRLFGQCGSGERAPGRAGRVGFGNPTHAQGAQPKAAQSERQSAHGSYSEAEGKGEGSAMT